MVEGENEDKDAHPASPAKNEIFFPLYSFFQSDKNSP